MPVQLEPCLDRRFRRFPAALAGLLLLLLSSLPARAEFQIEPAYPATPPKGPSAAKGAVIWNHGINGWLSAEASQGTVPTFMAVFRDAGWDIYRVLRARQSEEPNHSTAELITAIERLKQQGYAKIVMAGQSGGAWLSLMAAGRSDLVHAVIANAPAYYGVDRDQYQKNSFILLDHIGDIRHGRIMISYFKDDPYDPGGRGSKSAAILAGHNVPHVIVDQPEGFVGHHGGNTMLFRRRFGDCVLAVAGDGPMPTGEDCDSGWGRKPSAEMTLPADLEVAAPAGNNAPTDRFLGKWYGYYPNNGREMMLVIERVSGADVSAVYALSPNPDKTNKAEIVHRTGRLIDGSLVFIKQGSATLRYTPRPDGMLDAQWVSSDEKSHLEAVLRRLP